ncbi:MAG: hypothetical protein U9R42_03160 [Bacteroidota bacterium]|nr:hypothetical protein [Bacteroidota bacterium]
MSKIRDILIKTYFMQLIPALLILAVIEILKQKFSLLIDLSTSQIIKILTFVFATSTAIAFPIWYRLWFVNKVKNQKKISASEFVNFEKNIIFIVLLTPYFLIIASLFNFDSFFYYGTILLSLYACYYYYPTHKRIENEIKIFRMK